MAGLHLTSNPVRIALALALLFVFTTLVPASTRSPSAANDVHHPSDPSRIPSDGAVHGESSVRGAVREVVPPASAPDVVVPTFSDRGGRRGATDPGGAADAIAFLDVEGLGNARVFVYPLPKRFNADLVTGAARSARDPWAARYAPFSWEVTLHHAALASPRRVTDPTEADVLLVPVYPAAAVLRAPGEADSAGARNAARRLATGALRWVQREYPGLWARRGGVDHVVPFPYGSGPCMDPLSLHRPFHAPDEARLHAALVAALGPATVLSPFGDTTPRGDPTSPAPCFDPARSVVVPPAVGVAAARTGGLTRVPALDPLRWVSVLRGGDFGGAGADADAAADGNLDADASPAHARREAVIAAADALAEQRAAEPRGSRKLLLTFRGPTTLQTRAGGPWGTAARMAGGEAEARRGAPADLRPSAAPCFDNGRLHADPGACAMTCDWELSQTHPFSRGVRQVVKRAAAFMPAALGVRINSPPGRDAAEEMLASRFCLAPRGAHGWSRRLVDSLATGCVPVFVADDTLLPFEPVSAAAATADADALVRLPWDWAEAVLRVAEVDVVAAPLRARALGRVGRLRMQRAGARALADLLWLPTLSAGAAAWAVRVAAARVALWDAGAGGRALVRQPHLLAVRKPVDPPARVRARLRTSVLNPDPRPGTPHADDGAAFGREPLLCAMSQMTADRAPLLARTTAVWGGVLSIVVLTRDETADRQTIEAALGDRAQQVRVAFVEDEAWKHYPVNSLRNVALEGCPAGAPVLILDIDFMLSRGAYGRLQARLAAETGGERNAYLLPAFELEDAVVEAGRLDLDKADIVRMTRGDGAFNRVRKSDARPFHVRNFPYGHHMTNFERWYASDDAYPVEYEYSAEPYVLVRPPFPWFDESFVAYGQNKVQWLYEVAAAGFQYVVVPDAFVFHAHVEGSNGKQKREKDYKIGWSCWTRFLARVEEEYGYRPPHPCWSAVLLWQALAKFGDKCVTNDYDRTMPYSPLHFGAEGAHPAALSGPSDLDADGPQPAGLDPPVV